MAVVNVFGHATVRPVRVALLDPFDSPKSLHKAVGLASSHWGGMDYLLLPTPVTARGLQLGRRLVDVAAALEASTAAEIPEDLTFNSWPSKDPFDRGDGSLRNHVLGMESISAGTVPLSALDGWARLVWDPEHPLAEVLAVLHGNAEASGPYRPVERSRADLGASGAIPKDVQRSGLLPRTRKGLLPRSREGYRGVVCVDPRSLADLIGFWNLRACGADVALYAAGHQAALDAYLSDWFNEVAPGTERLLLWASTKRLASEVGAELQARFGRTFREQRLDPVPDWVYVLPVETHASQRFDVNIESDAWTARLPLPKLDLLPAASWYERFGTVSAEVSVTATWAGRARRSFSVPMRRELGVNLLRSRTSPGLTPFHLPTDDGAVVGVDARADSVDMPLLSAMEVLGALSSACQATVSRSDAGLYVEQLIDMLGGVTEDGVALQPGVRAVLQRAATAPYGRPVPALIAEARKRAGDWPTSFFGRGRDYPLWVVQWLCDKGLLHARLKSKCPACGNTLSISPADILDSVACPLCGESRPLALHLAALRPEWRLALHRAVQPERVSETFPVMASLSLLMGTRGYMREGLHSAVGVRFVHDDVDCELDLVVASLEGADPVLIIGECKSYRDSISRVDMENLRKVQQVFLRGGVECYVLFATMRSEFEDQELSGLKALAERVPSTGSFRSHQAIEPMPPIVLDGQSLSAHSFSDQSLLRLGAGPRTLSNLATASCMRNLGLKAYAYDGSGEPGAFTAVWNEPPQ